MKKAFSIFLAILMLASNIGIASNTHFCGGEAAEHTLSLGIEHLDCGMAETEQSCSSEDGHDQLNAKPCCDNQHELLQLDEDATLLQQAPEINKTFIAAFIHTFVVQVFSFEKKESFYLNYFPPLLKQDIQVLFQSFLI
ncbi:MAG TPA: hypothetical protein DCG19_08115 [Cryomorphaceae bacterium]|nr:hypothetical protein [Owenweeksia sp.]MBF99584.1 hypothetical protein [Owenweeksia sp.]HAD97357.1 hypothetical protein [Cryomorphaceae bacterium]HBF21253.1 hypothetical protein [Cryomorphaceae bacterium]|tara:strand:- start:702 stop:1118 length:417 start_codon:yes stop_codon:yes gene_type:complete